MSSAQDGKRLRPKQGSDRKVLAPPRSAAGHEKHLGAFACFGTSLEPCSGAGHLDNARRWLVGAHPQEGSLIGKNDEGGIPTPFRAVAIRVSAPYSTRRGSSL